MAALTRRAVELLLVRQDLAQGKGDPIQQGAYQEYEWRHCQQSYRYFQDNYCYIKLKSGRIVKWNDPDNDQLIYPIQYESGEEWERGESTAEVKARQLGQTTNAGLFLLWDCGFHQSVVWNVVGTEEGAGKDVLERIQPTMAMMPKWMLDRMRRSTAVEQGKRRRKADNVEGAKTIGFGDSRIIVRTSTPRAMQGKSGKVLLDDFGAHEDQERKWQLLYPVIDDPDPANRGQLIIIFNGNGKDTAYHIYKAAKKGDNCLKPHFRSWKDDPRRLWMADAEGNGPRCSLESRSVASEDVYPWYRQAMDNYLLENPDADVFAFKAQYPESEDEAFFLHGNSRFNMGTLNKLDKELLAESEAKKEEGKRWPDKGYMRVSDEDSTEYRFESHHTGRCRLYIPPDVKVSPTLKLPYKDYIVAVDAAGGAQAGDYCVAMVGGLLPGPTVEQLAVYQAKVEPLDLAVIAERLAWWYHEALMIPETGASGHGVAVTNALKERYLRIFKQIRTSRFIDEEKEELGWSTNRVSRDTLIDDLAKALSTDGIILHDALTLDELKTFEINPKTGKAEAPKGSNDDLVICAGLLVQGAKYLAVEESSTPSVYFSVYE